jgi:hypothetical protein
MYRQIKNIDGSTSNAYVHRISDGAFIPFDPANLDYQQYLVWLSQGNTPLPPL